MNLMSALSRYWEIENRPKTNLGKEQFKEIDTLTANWFYVGVTFAVFGTITFLMLMGVLASL